MATNRIVNEWVDAAGGFMRGAGWVDPAGGLASLQAALQGCSNAQLTFSTAGAPFTSGIAPSSNVTWYLCTDTMVINFQTVGGATIQLTIPAPKQSCFKSDLLTVDPASTPVAALIAAAIGTLSTVLGDDVSAYSTGVKSSRRTEQNAPPV